MQGLIGLELGEAMYRGFGFDLTVWVRAEGRNTYSGPPENNVDPRRIQLFADAKGIVVKVTVG